MLEDCEQVAADILPQLQTEWDAIGLEQQQQQQRLQQLRNSVQRVSQQALDHFAQIERDLEAKLNLELQECSHLAERLGLNIPVVEEGSLLDTTDRVHRNLEELQLMKDERIKCISALKNQCHSICKILGWKDEFEQKESVWTLERIDGLKDNLSELSERYEKVQSDTIGMIQDIVNLYTGLGLENEDISEGPFTDLMDLHPTLKDIASENYESIESFLNENIRNQLISCKAALEAERQRREEILTLLAKEILDLWNLLGVSENDRQDFLHGHHSIAMSSINACQIELKRLQEARQSQIDNEVSEYMKHLLELWNTCITGRETRENFSDSLLTPYTEETIDQIKAEIGRYEKRIEATKPIFALYERLQSLQQEKESYEASLNDPNRFRIPGRALVEEKIRKRIKRFPRILEKLIEEARKWEEQYRESLEYNGNRLVSTLLDQRDQYQQQVRPRRAQFNE